jgi:adenylate kinase family enzyme
MKEIEIQMNLIQLIMENKGNSLFLKKLSEYAQKLVEEQDWWDDLTEKQKNFVHKSAQQIDEGKVVPNAVVREEIKKRLSRP